MTQVKLWQIQSQNPNAIIFSDADGNLTSLPAGTKDQVLIINDQGMPQWVSNDALTAALEAKSDTVNALTTAKAYTDAQIAALVDNAPVALSTLNELAVKLNGEDSAINALIKQVDGKAEKTEVSTLVAQTKQDTVMDCKAYTDDAIGTLVSGLTTQFGQAKSDMLSQAATDATTKANAAQDGATQAANSFTSQKVADAMTAAGQDASTKADSAKSDAITEAEKYTDNAVITALSTSAADAQGKADAAQNKAIATAADDATAKVAGLQSAIPSSFWVEGTSTACFLASATKLDQKAATGDGVVVTDSFTEVTGAKVVANDPSLNAKLVFVNGVAVSDEWTASRTGSGQLTIKFSDRLAKQVFDGTENALMVLAEYKSYNAISVKS